MTRRRLDPESRKKEILQSAARAFATRPYDDVRVSAIARDSGASRALINHYFGDKRGLFVAVARELVARMRLRAPSDIGVGPETLLAANTRAWLDLAESSREASLLFLDDLGPVSSDPRLVELKDELRDRAARRILANHLGDGDLPPVARHAMRSATGLIERALRDWLTGRGGTREETERLIVESILAMVRHVIPALLDRKGAAGDAAGAGADGADGRPGGAPVDHDPLGEGPAGAGGRPGRS